MKKIILMCALSLLTAACAPALVAPEGCGSELSGARSVQVYYDEDGISVKAKVKVKKKKLLVVKLRPSSDFRDKKVTIDGLSVTVDPPGGPAPASPDWMDTSDSWNDRKSFVLCVPNIPDEKRVYVYKYSVHVEELGLLDPRIEVTW